MEFATNNAVNVATGHTPVFLQSGDHPIVPSILMHKGVGSSRVEAVQVMVDWMKTALEKAQTNLTIAQNWVKAYAAKLRWSEIFHEGDEVVPSTHNLSVN